MKILPTNKLWLPGLALAAIATYGISRSQLLDRQAGRLFTAALLALAYLAFCFVTYIKSRNKHRRALQLTAAPDGGSGQALTLVAYASQTGYAEQIALQTAQALQAGGMPVQLLSLAKLDRNALAAASRILFVVSTTGEGDAPDSAAGFARKLMGQPLPLAQLHYGMLALGDRSYAQYCAFGHRLEHWLRHQGAQNLFDTIEVDNGDEGALRHWQHHLGVLSGHTEMADWSAPSYAAWTLAERRLLNPGSAGAPAFHLGLSAPDGPTWQAGDIAEIGPRNAPQRVQKLIAQLQLEAVAPVVDGSQKIALDACLADRLLPHDAAGVAALQGFSAQQLAAALKPLPHREYSIASIAGDGRLELLVRQTQLANGELGLGSGWLTEYAPLGGEIALRVRENRGFQPPADDRAMILIGNGTGLAGLRAHLREREKRGHRRNWLLFGERSAAHDYFHRTELERWLANGVLQRLDLAFSRDQQHRVYVQDRLSEQAALVRRWVADGAAIYVCGSLEGMAAGAHAALTAILGQEKLEQMAEDGNYRRDVY
ncbi:sulfite reductase flavoprotein subunit alpha [Undibacterium sp.]|jgi:sulfite reductase (NADPH) flavoprotein alpha-component|uniref:sulfite reductase subunit alpha n=1 Tax=Undibacterium sp. TaxID=1914977 RepID=UPI002C761B61|nr:sulfite reductase flavoprotein subunit alpha [Undibacterium sp.]HTD04304.1 sulfite reductase flavoprotein subunit alpha [Undibacterium sp.]